MMHLRITTNTCAMVAFLATHDSIFGETLLTGFASRRAAALKMAVSLRCLKGEFKVSVYGCISGSILDSDHCFSSPREDRWVCECLDIAVFEKLFIARSRTANTSPHFGVKLR